MDQPLIVRWLNSTITPALLNYDLKFMPYEQKRVFDQTLANHKIANVRQSSPTLQFDMLTFLSILQSQKDEKEFREKLEVFFANEKL